MDEIWLPYQKAPRYMISSLGRLRNMSLVGTSKDRIFTGALNKQGYLTVRIDGKTLYVHAMVLETFVCERPPNCIARHKDGQRTNNSIENLSWGTHKQNTRDMLQAGVASAKLSPMGVRVIRRLADMIPQCEIAEIFGVSGSTITRVVLGRGWEFVC